MARGRTGASRAKRPLRWLALATALATPWGGSPAQAQTADWDTTVRGFADQISADVDADGIGGITAAVFQGPDVLWARGFGYADRDTRRPAGVATLYRTGSISKTVTALLMAILAQDGVVQLDAPVAADLPEVAEVVDRPSNAPPVTYRHLASHTAGWVREPSNMEMASGPIALWEDRVLGSLPLTSYYGMPGESYLYSNIGFGVMGLALSRAADRPFMDLVVERIFEPLGMEGSTFVLDERLGRRMSTGYANFDDGEGVNTELPAAEHRGRGYKVPNGGVYSTVQDMARFAAALSGHGDATVLTDAMRHEMLRVQTPEDPDSGYGLGVRIHSTEGGHVLAGHGGSVAGYTAHLLFDIESGLGVVLLRNYNSGATNLGGAARELLTSLLAIGARVS